MSLFDPVTPPTGTKPVEDRPVFAPDRTGPVPVVNGNGTEREPEPAPRTTRQPAVETGKAAAPEAEAAPRKVRKGKRRARRVHRVVRHVDPWSVLKISLLFYLCAYVIVMVAGVLLWRAADEAGTIEGIEGFIESAGTFEEGSYHFVATEIFQASAIAGGIVVILATALTVVAALLFNVFSDLTGGIRVTVIEEDVAIAPAPPNRRPAAPSK